LEYAGFTVDAAGSASEAMNKLALAHGAVDAVIVDIGLPDRGGDVLIREMRSIHPSLPIVLATGRGALNLKDVLGGEEKVALVTKPYTAQDLLGALRRAGIEVRDD
jgi:DNA-binding response OmpR family regulator